MLMMYQVIFLQYFCDISKNIRTESVSLVHNITILESDDTVKLSEIISNINDDDSVIRKMMISASFYF